MVYIEIISLQRENQEEDSNLYESIKQKLQNLLQTSNYYDAAMVLSCLLKNGLDYESAFLYGKMGNHTQAFEIYLFKYTDYEQALKHCILYDSPHSVPNIFNTLFSVYLALFHK